MVSHMDLEPVAVGRRAQHTVGRPPPPQAHIQGAHASLNEGEVTRYM